MVAGKEPSMSGSSSVATSPNASDASPRRTADAIRYILLRKLASGLRHAMMGELQTLQFNAELCVQMLQGGRTGADLSSHLSRVPVQTKAAAATYRATIEWLRPDSNATAPLGDVLDACLKLAGDDWMLRGIGTEISVGARERSVVVARATSSEVIVASLLTLVDVRESALDIHVDAGSSGEWVTLTSRAIPPAQPASIAVPLVYAKLGFDDVLTLAAESAVHCQYDLVENSIELRLPRAIARQ